MADPDLMRAIGRLEKTLDDAAKENGRRFDIQAQKQADQDKTLGRIAERIDVVEKRMDRVEQTAGKAQRQANDSAAEIHTINTSLIRHIDVLESAINDGKMETSMRLDAQDKVLAGQNKSLTDIQAVMQSAVHAQTAVAYATEKREAESAKRFDRRLALAVGLVVALVPVLNRLVDAITQ